MVIRRLFLKYLNSIYTICQLSLTIGADQTRTHQKK
jgi:hypothetical protein